MLAAKDALAEDDAPRSSNNADAALLDIGPVISESQLANTE